MDYVEDYLQYLLTSFKADKEQYTYGEDLESQIPEVIRMYREDGHNTNQGFMAIGSRESIKLPSWAVLRGCMPCSEKRWTTQAENTAKQSCPGYRFKRSRCTAFLHRISVSLDARSPPPYGCKSKVH